MSDTELTEEKMLKFDYYFTKSDIDPFEEITWEKRIASIKEDGKTIFKQEVEVPSFWSQNATDIVAQHYLKVVDGVKENSAKQSVLRISKTITKNGVKGGYFDKANGEIFEKELRWLLINQYFCFNSPVWYNVGIHKNPQASACFIQSVEDNIESLCELQTKETQLFRRGSGTGTNYSTLRRKGAELSNGGSSSGPVSFMKGFDTWAGITKSGGSTRRAACMRILNINHPDVEEFIDTKVISEKMARDLIKLGWPSDYNSIVYSSLPYQNANHSVRVTDDFMNAVKKDGSFNLIDRGTIYKSVRAKDLFRRISSAAYECADPGLQFDNIINDWHTCKVSGRINSSNPCSEYMFLDDTACNLASHNLVKYLKDNKFQTTQFIKATEIGITAMEILVSFSSYPTEKITKNSHDFRPLGIGWSNGGAALMRLGLPYDSNQGRHLLASITSLMSASAYRQSAIISRDCGGPFKYFNENKESFMKVIEKHAISNFSLSLSSAVHPSIYKYIQEVAENTWKEAEELGEQFGYRNSQISVLAPAGTISFKMDCDTTGIEPDIALVKYKKLAGGGSMKIVNKSVKPALENLGYTPEQIEIIELHILKYETILGAPDFKKEHLPIFDCAVGIRSIKPMGHIMMMASCQPFLSGAISKTVNLPSTATIEDIEDIYMKSWELGLKAVAVYRDNCKGSQPLNVQDFSEKMTQTCGFCEGPLVRTGSCLTCTECGIASSCG